MSSFSFQGKRSEWCKCSDFTFGYCYYYSAFLSLAIVAIEHTRAQFSVRSCSRNQVRFTNKLNQFSFFFQSHCKLMKVKLMLFYRFQFCGRCQMLKSLVSGWSQNMSICVTPTNLISPLNVKLPKWNLSTLGCDLLKLNFNSLTLLFEIFFTFLLLFLCFAVSTA